MSTFDELRALVASKLDVPEEKITESSHFVDDLGADSLDRADLVMEIEEKFNVSFADQNAEEFATVGDVFKAIEAIKG
ncbi:MAG: acyl carrier protein [bacterium]|jgi:acyl carrier protein